MNLRLRLLLALLPSIILPLIAASLGQTPWVVCAAALLGVAWSAIGIVLLTRPFLRLIFKAKDCLLRAGLGDLDTVRVSSELAFDGTNQIYNALSILQNSYRSTRDTLVARNKQYESSMSQFAADLIALAKYGKLTNNRMISESPWQDKNQAVDSGIQHVSLCIQSLNRKIATLLNIINDIPESVIVLDSRMNIQFVNSTAEKLIGSSLDKLQNKQIKNLFTNNSSNTGMHQDAAPYVRVDELTQWLQHGRGGNCEALLDSGDEFGIPVQVGVVSSVDKKSKQAIVLMVRDLSSTKRAEQNIRQLHRRLIGQRMSLMVAKEATPSMDVIRTQVALLSQAAKQTGQREKFMPKVARIIEEVHKHELVVQLLGWLCRLSTTQAADPDAEELRLRTIADDIIEKLMGSFSERGNRIEINGDAGWIVADDSRINIMLTGLLVHANTSIEQSLVKVELNRRSMISSAEELSEITISYPGEKLSSDVIEDLKDPFRRINSSIFDVSLRTGFLLGPAVASRVAGLMGGELIIDYDEGNVILRAILPTRDRAANPQLTQVIENKDLVPGSGNIEMLGDWSLGGKMIEDTSHSDTENSESRNKEYVETANSIKPTDDTISSFFN